MTKSLKNQTWVGNNDYFKNKLIGWLYSQDVNVISLQLMPLSVDVNSILIDKLENLHG